MALRNIIKEGDPILLKKSRPVTAFNERLHILIDDMRETLLNAEGIGLAAPQVGVLRRVVLVRDVSRQDRPPREQIIELVNPEIVTQEGQQSGGEGCLSLPGIMGIVKRPMYVRVKAQDRYGGQFEVRGEGLIARAFCHELDHLEGQLFTRLAEELFHVDESDGGRTVERKRAERR